MSCRLDGGVSDPLCVNFAVLMVGRSVDRLVVVSVPVQQWDYYPHNNVGGLLFSSVVFACVVQALFFSRRERLRKTFTGRPGIGKKT